MPNDAPEAKVEATRGYGAEIVRYERFTESREEIGAALAGERGLALVKPYDDPLVMAGQGTTALELLEDAPEAKVEATRGYGAEIVRYDRFTESREEIGAALAVERGLALVKPYDDPLVMAGQGTTALELLEDVPELDVLVTPVGGGGLAAGCATAVKTLRPGARVVGVEPEAGDDTARSLAAGKRVAVGVPRTIADGLQAPEPGELTFEVNRRRVDEVVTVSDAEIVDAMAFLFDRMKLVVEPSGAVGIAALLTRRIDARDRTVGVVISGGNVGAARFAELIAGR
ncbi:MAG: pyridoxal-phosphate dependent enzyme [Actinobacteria bacterium]|nr:pyridoxal-phosphate dependent enzyme [Actinomycetota bacterium]